MRLIDADALLARWNAAAFHMLKDKDGKHPISLEAIVEEVETRPTIDAVPIVHGRWNFTDFVGEDWCSIKRAWECSNCHYQIESKSKNHIYPKHMKYCPHCGAKMDGDTK